MQPKKQIMSDLIEALQILLKCGNPLYPTHCEHDVLTVVGIDPSDVSEDDKEKLVRLGFFVSEECFRSFKSVAAEVTLPQLAHILSKTRAGVLNL
jgi:hypothetical protein